jgi:hypothetical protein
VSFCSIVFNQKGNNVPCVSSFIKNHTYGYSNLVKVSDYANAGMICNTSK